MRKAAVVVLLALFAAETAWLIYPAARAWVFSHQESAAARGRRVALAQGCFNCHGPDGRGGVSNPGSEWETVPGFGEQTLMMFATEDRELREYVLDGAPARKREDPDYEKAMKSQALRMPAYRGWLSERQVGDLVAYLREVSGLLAPPEGPVARGAEVAHKVGCFNCHGEMGMGGRENPGSFKGYIPGFYGDDFTDLVRSDDELLEWIRQGSIARIREHPIGGYFFSRQRIAMPVYGEFLSEAEIADLASYLRWLAGESWRTAPLGH